MTNLALYYRFVDAVRKYYITSHRGSKKEFTDIMQTEDCFIFKVLVYADKHFDPFDAFMKTRGWKPFTSEEYKYVKTEIFEIKADVPDYAEDNSDIFSLSSPFKLSSVYRRYLHIIYNKKQDKVAIGYKDTGYGWAHSKTKYYPYNHSEPVLTKTDKFWRFKKQRKKKLQVRELKLNHDLPDSIDYAMRSIFNLEHLEEHHEIEFYNDHPEDSGGTPPVLFRHALLCNNLYDAIETSLKISFPKALKKRVDLRELWNIGKIIEPSDFNKLCQAVADKDKELAVMNRSRPIYDLLALVHNIYCKQHKSEISNWLIRDYIYDHLKLKKKMNLKLSSLKRIQEEHERNADLIRSSEQGVIKVHKKFNKCFIGFRGEWELITTRARLNQEGLQQKHCVAGYGPQINRGESCIVSLMWEGDRYTVELGCISAKKPTFYIKQLQGYRNSQEKPVPDSLYLAIEEDCNIMTQAHFNNAFHVEPVLQEVEPNP